MSERELTLQDYQRAVINATCHWDGAELGPIQNFDHSGGFQVKGFAERQWLYARCLKCGYDWAIWKLLDREEPLMPTEHAEKLVRARIPEVPDSTLAYLGITRKELNDLAKEIDRKTPSRDRPWRGVCCKSCWFARKPKCRCRCRKRNHQKGFQKEIGEFIIQADSLPVNPISIGEKENER